MSFEAINYAQKRVRAVGNREWKLWFTLDADTLKFRLLTKDNADCYESITGEAQSNPAEDVHVREDGDENGYMSTRYHYATEGGTLDIYLEVENQELAWVAASGSLAVGDCSLGLDLPLMPEVAG